MTDKSTILKAFNTLFFDFLDDIIGIVEDAGDIRSAKTSFEMFRKGNPTIIIKVWHTYIYVPYAQVIEAGDLEFFVNKDYTGDLSVLANSGDVVKTIDKIREPIRNMTETNKAHSLAYIQKLSKLSAVYSG
jgi:hypothetical protein